MEFRVSNYKLTDDNLIFLGCIGSRFHGDWRLVTEDWRSLLLYHLRYPEISFIFLRRVLKGAIMA